MNIAHPASLGLVQMLAIGQQMILQTLMLIQIGRWTNDCNTDEGYAGYLDIYFTRTNKRYAFLAALCIPTLYTNNNISGF